MIEERQEERTNIPIIYKFQFRKSNPNKPKRKKTTKR